MSRKGRKARAEAKGKKAVDVQDAVRTGRDSYLSQISDASLEVLEHFGAEAPAKLNMYACALEDRLIEVTKKLRALEEKGS